MVKSSMICLNVVYCLSLFSTRSQLYVIYYFNNNCSNALQHAKTQIEATVEKFQKTELQVLLCTTSKDELRSICVQKGIQCTQEYYNELCDKFKIERKSMSRMEQLLASIADIHTKYGQLCTDEFLNK